MQDGTSTERVFDEMQADSASKHFYDVRSMAKSSPYVVISQFPFQWRWHILVVGLLVFTATLRLLYLIHSCPLDLAPDEAHYWDWSRNLDWSYYSKGPLVAYLIRLSCAIWGNWSQALVGTQVLAVRIPAIICSSLMLLSLYVLIIKIYHDGRFGFLVVAGCLTVPLVAAGSLIMTIDAPYACLWGWALVLGHQAVFRKSAWAWPLLGLVVGAGILAKYTMVLWLPSLALFLLFDRQRRAQLLRSGFWSAATISALCCVPILIWNIQHNWIGVMHVGNLAGMRKEGTRLHWTGPLTYLGLQFAILLGFWSIVWVRAMWAKAPWHHQTSDEERYVWWLSAPMFLVFLVFSPLTGGGEANWPVTAYLSGMVLAAGWLHEHWKQASRLYRRFLTACVAATCAAGLLLSVTIHKTELLYPFLAQFAGEPTADRPFPMRRLDPTCRLRGWRTIAHVVDETVAQLRSQGIEPIIVADRWNVSGEIAFYCSDHPTVYSIGLALGDRHSQYDVWRPNPVLDPEPFLGRTFVLISGIHLPAMSDIFERIEQPLLVYHDVQGHPVAGWQVTVCHGFKGFPIVSGHHQAY